MRNRLFRRMVRFVVNKGLGCLDYEIRKIPPTEKNKYVWLKNSNIRTVIDIGANEGQFVKKIYHLLPDATVYSFEPLQECYSKLCQLCEQYKAFRAFPYACGEKEEKVKMFRSQFSPSSSLLEMADRHKELYPHTRDIFHETVIVKRLDDIADTLTIDKELLVKIDVQGFEDRVIKGGKKTISEAKIILIEVSFDKLYEGQAEFHTIYTLLYQLGLQFAGFVDQFCDSKTGIPIQVDAIFMRKR